MDAYFGPVNIVGGEHQGKIGYVDHYDDEGDEGHFSAVVYLAGKTTQHDSVRIAPSDLDQPELDRELEQLEARLWSTDALQLQPAWL